MCKLEVWALQSQYIQVNRFKDEEEEEPEDDDEEELNDDLADPKVADEKEPARRLQEKRVTVDQEDTVDREAENQVVGEPGQPKLYEIKCGFNKYVKGLGFQY